MHLRNVQFTDGVRIATEGTYRDVGATPYSSPTFHAALRKAFKARAGKLTPNDLGFADYACDALLRHGELVERNSAVGTNEEYTKFVVKARAMLHKSIQTEDGSSAIRIVPAAEAFRCVY